VKIIVLFFFIICLFGCVGTNTTQNVEIIDCPNVYFSSENNVFIQGYKNNMDYNDIIYKASLNNYGFGKNCTANLENQIYPLELLIVVSPFNLKNSEISIPIFILFYDEKDNVVERLFFMVSGNINYNKDLLEFETTEIIKKMEILLDLEKQVDSIVIGFVKIKEG